ncbi:uncharacterized protein BROUX77_007129 [Berkeleyomyces rouxiae]|uniref:uncharacterized protein n=1 Tax=Berkeleyomyces rouxiae TaxID=2035830 RepID=UPI003B78FF5E
MHSSPFLIEAFIDNSFYCDALFDSGCLVTSAFNESLVKKKGLQRMPITKRELRLAENDDKKRWISEIAFCELDIDGRKETVYGYVIPNLAYDMILGKPWMERNDVVYLAKERVIRLGSGADALMVREKGWLDAHVPGAKANMVMASVFAAEIRHSKKKNEEIQVFAATIHDINKALEVKRRMTLGEITEQLSEELKHLGHVFLDDEKRDLPPNRPGIDHAIKLTKDNNGKEKEVPWGPLYGMSRDELLVLRKTLSDHLDKNWIRASSSPGGAPVLFVRKPGGGLRFCVDYRGINAITEKDRYPLPLISETLRSLAKARYFTKVDVRAAFHKIRVKEGDEWKTAFRTRFGLYEWLVTPFGLTGAPATFQRYINSTLREHLDDFCSAYLDDVLIYTDGSRKEHMEKVELVLKKLGDAGLCLDLNKCEFAVTETKYLGFIIQAGQGVKVDPAKVAAIREWVPPTNVKGVRSFIGFANFYRQFIDSFSEVAAPLVSLTKKGVPWKWGQAEERAFETLKNLFITAPVLAMWDEDRTTVVECDCSGWALGGTLSQVDDDGKLRPVAFFSKKLSPAEVNYEIHDKELLAVVKCLEEWRGELKSLGAPFKILSDHKNLQYFMTTRKLSERQVRWSQMLSEFDFKLEFRSGSKSGKPDALSRRQQDVPQGEDDDRLKSRIMKLIKDQWIPHTATVPVAAGDIAESPDNVPDGSRLFVQPHLQELWDQAKDHDSDMQEMYQALAAGERSFPPSLTKKITISIAECEFDQRGALLYRHKLCIPEWEPLRTALIQKTHDSHITGHPGRDGTLAILSREFFWPGISRDVRRFCANCNVCGRSKVWRERKKGLLLPLPIPQRPHSELGIDFMTELPAKKSGDPRYLMVIVDRLTGGVALEAMNTMKAEECAERFLQCYWKHHGFPRALVSDRGTNWTSEFWTHLCKLTGIEQRLSTGFHPQTDGATERMNQEVLTYLRSFITYSQYDWPDLLPSAMLAINNRNTSMGMSPFFLTHGYHVSPIEQFTAEESVPRRLEHRDAEKFIQRLHEGWELAQAAMAARQQDMEDQANRSRGPQVRFEVGDTVWLKLKNISTPQLSKKLSWTNAMYKVRKIVSPHVVELDVPTNVHPRFHVDLLKPASQNPFPSQETDDTQPPPIEENEYGEPEYLVERILRSRQRRVGRGYRREVLVKWAGYAEPDWRPRVDFEDTEALEMFEAEFGTEDDVGNEVFIRLPTPLRLTNCTANPDVLPVTAHAVRAFHLRARRSHNVRIFSATLHDIEKALKAKIYTDPRANCPEWLLPVIDAFDRKKASELPPNRPGIDTEIRLKPGLSPPSCPLYSMSREELLLLRKTLYDLLDAGFIRASSAEGGAPVIFVKKPGGGLRFCVDYRALNSVTEKDGYPLPLINDTLRDIAAAKYVSKVDVISAFHRLRLKEGSEAYTAFRTHLGAYEWLVTPFGLTGAPAAFQRFINHVLSRWLGISCSAYLDDVVIYSSDSRKEHRNLVCQIIRALGDAGLQLDWDKSEFESPSIKYLGFIVEPGSGIRADPDKVKAIQEWEAPTSVRGVRSFLGFANFYRCFVPEYSTVAAPLTLLTKKDQPFKWEDEQLRSFEALKKALVSAPLLATFDPDLPTIVEADASGWALGGSLRQQGADSLWRPVAYFSRKLSPAEVNYPIHDKEMLAIHSCLRAWRSYLAGIPFEVHTDHQNLLYFQKQRTLSEHRGTPTTKMAKSTEKLTKTTLSNSSIDSKTSSSSASNKIDKKPTARDETRRTTRLGLSFAQMASQEPRSDDDELLRSPSQHAPVTSSMKVDAGVEDAPVVEIPLTPDSRDSDATTPTPNALDGNLFVFSQAQRDENDTNNINNTNNTNNNNNDQVAVVQWYSTWQGFSVGYREVVGSIPTSDANFLRAVNLNWGTWG